MKFFPLDTIKSAIEHLQEFSANWLLPAFVFAANDVGQEALVDMSEGLGTDKFLNQYFDGSLIGLPPMARGNNLLRPRLKGITWNRGEFADDFIVRQDTKMWGNLFSSRGYREMRMQGLIEGEKAIVRLTPQFKERFDIEIPESFQFERFLIWLFAFKGVPDSVNSWAELYAHLLSTLNLERFKDDYLARFKLSAPAPAWPELLAERPSNADFLSTLAPKLSASMAAGQEVDPLAPAEPPALNHLSEDDPILAAVVAALQANESLAFLLAGPPGTGKTHYAKKIAISLAEGQDERVLTIQFHPAIGYDDFIEGFRPLQSEDKTGIRYDLAPRLFMNFCAEAAKQPSSKFVIIIDELNRGDVARIFGEVLTYLEYDYRDIDFTLPLSGSKVRIPRNLVMITTANPYDRSVTDMDDALLRRFWVIELGPDAEFLRNHLEKASVDANVINRTVQLFKLVNTAFPHGFGHTNFLRVRSVEDLAAVWVSRVRLALRRALMHDRVSYEATEKQIEALLQSPQDEAEVAQ